MKGFPRVSGFPSSSLLASLLLASSLPAFAQFKEIGPAPFSPAVAHERIRALLDQAQPSNRQQTLDSINALTPWFRNVLDDELIAAWQGENRERVTLVLEPLADASVAAGIVQFSWQKRTDATLNLNYAPLLGNLMARYPESGNVFLSDLLAPAPPALSPPQAEAVCRILLDMPDVGTWHQSALRILPRYRATTDRLLRQDRQGQDQEKSYRAQIWQAELRGETPGVADQAAQQRRNVGIAPAPNNSASPRLYPPPSAPPQPAPASVAANRPAPPPTFAPIPAPPPPSSNPNPPAPGPRPLAPDSAPGPRPLAPDSAPGSRPLASAQSYNGPMSGTLECSGSPVPQNAEYVFRNLPPLKMQLDYDTKIWEARFSPGENQTQRLVLKNKSSGPQKRCVVHWNIVR
jgi:hypothetical protein